MTVGEAIARTLVDEGIDAVFSLLGDGTFRIVYHLAALGVPVYEGRHEAYVYAMADGYSRASGKPTVCAITGGPALGHTVTPMTSAARSGAPVILLTGPSSRDDVGGRQRIDHEALTRLTGAAYFPVHGSAAAIVRTRQVVESTRRTRTPAVLDVPEVVQAEQFTGGLGERVAQFAEQVRLQPDPSQVDDAARLIGSAARPVLVAGAGAVRSEARDELVALADAIGALLSTTINARGYFHGHPYNAGVTGGFASAPAEQLLPEADLVIAFGAGMDRFTTRDGALYPDASFVQVNIAPPAPLGSGRLADVSIQGDAREVAAALRAALPERHRAGFRSEEVAGLLAGPPDDLTVEVEDGRVDPRDLCARLDELLPPTCGWASGNSGHFWAFPIMHMPRFRQPLLHASSFGAIGYGMAVGLGAALADGAEPVVAFEGDAGAVMHIQALETAARYRARLLVVVLNDGALGAEYHGMLAEGYDPALSLTPDVDLAGVARRLGCPAATITHLDQLAAPVEEFLVGDGPMLLDARVSRRVLSRPTRRLHSR